MSTRPIPDHGTASRYRGDPRNKRWNPCHCGPCLTAYRRRRKTVELRVASGGKARYETEPIAQHLDRLTASGWTYQEISDTTQVSRRNLYNIRKRTTPTVQHKTAVKLLALKPGRPTTQINPIGAARRIHALAAIGWSMTQTAQHAGLSLHTVILISGGKPTFITPATHQAIDRAYRTYCAIPGPSGWVRAFAAKKGWVSPAAWDDIDDPDALPEVDEAEPQDEKRNDLAKVIAEEIQHLGSFRLSAQEIARRVGRSESYVRQQLSGDRGPGWRHNLQEAA